VRRPRAAGKADKLVHNEQTKLLANFVNSAAVSFLAAGVIAPAISLLNATIDRPAWQLALLLVGCLVISGSLHYAARQVLKGLVE